VHNRTVNLSSGTLLMSMQKEGGSEFHYVGTLE